MRRVKVSNDDELKIITGMIVSNEFCKQIVPLTRSEHFTVPYAQTVFKWIDKYYQEFHEAPGTKIQDLFQIYSHKSHDDDELALISGFLKKLNDDYLDEEEGSYTQQLNHDFYFDRAVEHIKKRNIITHAEQTLRLAEHATLQEAEDHAMGFSKVMKITSSMFNPDDPVEVAGFADEKKESELLKFPGALGQLFGPWQRSWLAVGQGPYGVGKTSFLQEIKFLARSERLNVVDFNLEMSKRQFKDRYYRRLASSTGAGGQFLFPVFDCLWNQVGNCNKSVRSCDSKIRFSPEDHKPAFLDAPKDYRHCTACRGTSEFAPDAWFEVIERDPMDTVMLESLTNASIRSYGNNLRAICYPRGTANSSHMRRDLDILEYTEGFIPDVILVDYLDIMAPENNRCNTNEEKLNDNALALSQMAQELHAIVVTMSQVKTEVIEKGRARHGRMGDASGSSRAIYAHADFVFALMQTNEEKAAGILRLNIVKNREGDFNEMNEVLVLQQLEVANAMLDVEHKPLRSP